jgi:hypothetical protein
MGMAGFIPWVRGAKPSQGFCPNARQPCAAGVLGLLCHVAKMQAALLCQVLCHAPIVRA